MKRLAKNIVVAVLNWQTRRLYNKNSFKVVVVSGSIGKTSTKLAVAQLLSVRFKVQYQDGNYNDVVTVPLVFFGLTEPSLMNPLAWFGTFLKIEQILKKPYPYDVVVVEVGTDYPGNLAKFKSYLRGDIGVVTGVALEHMEFFDDLDAVAQEEFSISEYCDQLLANADLCDQKYLRPFAERVKTYALNSDAAYKFTDIATNKTSTSFTVLADGKQITTAVYPTIFPTKLYSLCAAVSVGHALGLASEKLVAGLAKVLPVNGRMQLLEGINQTTIIDDTYNASPGAMKAALDALYSLEAPQKIALLGNMNELGSYSEAAHTEVGNYCDPKQLSVVVTLGTDANKFLATAAKASGCQVKAVDTPYEAAEFIKTILKPGAVLLAKGSQNGVFAEEAVKQLLANPEDVSLLIRQSKDWMRIKEKNFGKVVHE